MRNAANASTYAPVSAHIWLQRIGAWGSVAALAILGTSLLLRLTTVIAVDGHPVSTLPPAIEQAARLLHRLCASGVALLALGAVVLCWTQRRSAAHLAWPVAWIVGCTLVLAVIGPLTPGYRVAAVTVVNVSTGVLLLMAFWWLRESSAPAAGARRALDAFSWVALSAFVVHVATGAAASAGARHGLRWPAFAHLGSLALCLILLGALLIEQRGNRALRSHTALMAGLLGAQCLLGYVMMWQDPRPVALSYAHAMVTPLLAMALVSLLQRIAPEPGPAAA